MPPSELRKISPAILFAISLTLICATILWPAGAVGQSISVASVGPTLADFGAQASSTASEKRVIILSNAGSDALPVTKIALRGDFVVIHDCASLLPAGYECSLFVSLNASGVGFPVVRLTITE